MNTQYLNNISNALNLAARKLLNFANVKLLNSPLIKHAVTEAQMNALLECVCPYASCYTSNCGCVAIITTEW